jgi:hypothetical protein
LAGEETNTLLTWPKGQDEWWPKRIVAEARIHLASIYAGHFDENFYRCLCLIVNHRVYLGYRVKVDKEIKLKGIKDFLFSIHYGLGIEDLVEFISITTRLAVEDKSSEKYARTFLRWIRHQDSIFALPPEAWEYKRIFTGLKLQARKDIKAKKKPDNRMYAYLKTLYHCHPEVLIEIGKGRKYANVYEAVIDLGIAVKKERSIIRIARPENVEQITETAEALCKQLGLAVSKVFIRKMLDYIKSQENIEAHK